jgi:hypothetical protein
MVSSIDKHPQRATIIEGLLAGKSLRAIGNSVNPPVHHVVLHKYKRKHIQPTMDGAAVLSTALKALADSGEGNGVTIDAVTATRAALLADPYLARTAQHRATIDRSLTQAEADGDGRTVAALIGTDLKGLELDARLSGRLDSAQAANQTIYIVTPAVSIQAVPQGPEPMVIDVTPAGGK